MMSSWWTKFTEVAECNELSWHVQVIKVILRHQYINTYFASWFIANIFMNCHDNLFHINTCRCVWTDRPVWMPVYIHTHIGEHGLERHMSICVCVCMRGLWSKDLQIGLQVCISWQIMPVLWCYATRCYK